MREDRLSDVEALSHPRKVRCGDNTVEVTARAHESSVVPQGAPRQHHLKEVLGQRQEQRWRSSRRPQGDSSPRAAEARYGSAHDADREVEGQTRHRGHAPRRSAETLK